ncbi:MAG: hypothetical protein KDC43_02275, partial [Saprospiraceae bacterium]|nr:hypothetical protein [Saprospiraceae bacterium]
MKRLIVLLLFALPQLLAAQACLPDGITIANQAVLDAFATSYPGCSIIEGDVVIEGPLITDLSGLSQVVAVEGYLGINLTTQL